MAGLVPAIHASPRAQRKTWMPGSRPGMTTSNVASPIVILDRAARDQPVPDEQHHQRADRGGDVARAFVRAVMADRLADPGGKERAGNAEQDCQDEAARIVRSGRQKA